MSRTKEVSTTVTHVKISQSGAITALITSKTKDDIFASELREFTFDEPSDQKLLFRRDEWLTDFFTFPAGTRSIVSRWDNRIYDVSGDSVGKVDRPCDAITRVFGFHDGSIYCTCFRGQVEVMVDGQWSSITIGRDVDLFSVLKIYTNEVYICGAHGTFGRWDGRSWHPIELPTDTDLFGLAKAPDGEIVVCGDWGAFKGYGEEWRALDNASASFCVAKASGQEVYLGAGDQGLFRLERDNIVQLRSDIYCYDFDISEKSIVACGANMIFLVKDDLNIEIEIEHIM